MTAPIQGAQVAQQAQQTSQKEVQLTKLQESKFDGVMAQKAQQAQAANQVQQTAGVQKAQQVTQTQKVTETQKADKARLDKTNTLSDKAVEGAHKEQPTLLMKMVGDIEHGQTNMDQMIKMALNNSGKHKMDYQQLTVLQMQVYQYSQEMELTSKVVEKATSGLKDTLKTQV